MLKMSQQWCLYGAVSLLLLNQSGVMPTAAQEAVDTSVCGQPATLISELQGSAMTTPNPAIDVVIEGIVIGDYQSSNRLGGFFVQEEDADQDGDPATSEGIFVADGNRPAVDVNVGDLVRISGKALELVTRADNLTSSLTEIGNVSEVIVCASDQVLPAPSILQLPATAEQREAVEGMLVTIPTDLTVAEYFELGRYGQIVLASGGRPYQYTQLYTPSVEGYAEYLNTMASHRIFLDDGSSVQNPDPVVIPHPELSAWNTLRGGNTISGLTGVLDERNGYYRIQYLAYDPPVFATANPRPARPNFNDNVLVASFNVLNYFNGNGEGAGFPTSRGAESLDEFARQRVKIIEAILALRADVVGLIEIENDGGENSAVADLVAGLNEAVGEERYAYIETGVIGTDAIKQALIYQLAWVRPVGEFAIDLNPIHSRPPLAQTFEEIGTGAVFTVVVNHFKSKSCTDARGEDGDAGDGQSCFNATRVAQAQALIDWLATQPTGTTDPDILIIGDLNAYAMEDPIRLLAEAGYQNLFGSLAYGYVFDGYVGTLDYALASTSLAGQVSALTHWNINADEPNVYDYNVNFKSPEQVLSFFAENVFRSSDHDPVLVGFRLH